MKNVTKSIIFVLVFAIIFETISYALLPGNNIKKFGSYKVAAYEILGEKENTIDAIFLGDSLIYSSVSPMLIWNQYGYTTFDCAQPAQVIRDTKRYLEVILESQNPKIILMEANVIFRDGSKRKWMTVALNEFARFMPILDYHTNWKKYINSGSKDNWINVDKGYKYITKTKGVSNSDYMKV